VRCNHTGGSSSGCAGGTGAVFSRFVKVEFKVLVLLDALDASRIFTTSAP
jgi:hypothetical protein